MRSAVALLIVALAACPRGKDKTIEPGQKKDGGSRLLPGDDGGASSAELPPAPPLPAVALGLPAIPPPRGATPELVALGEALFGEPRLGRDGKTSCATCHDPAHDDSGGRNPTALGQPNLRRTPALTNLAWKKSLGWDGRHEPADYVGAHVRGQLGDELATGVARLADDPRYRAHFARVRDAGGAGDPPTDAALALLAYVMTRYEGDSPWDRAEHSGAPAADLKAGYALFTSKARCATCHTPPLYTDLGYHHIIHGTTDDKGRGLVDAAETGAFATPSLRGAAARTSFFHDGSAASLDAAIDAHLAGEDPELKKVVLKPGERDQLLAFVRALTPNVPRGKDAP